MANEKNLEKGKATRFKSGDEAAKYGSKGGKVSGESKRNKKLLRECLEELLEREMIDKNGVSMTGAEALSAKLFAEALKGNVKAFVALRDTAGEKPIEKVVTAEVDSSVIAEIEGIVNGEDESD